MGSGYDICWDENAFRSVQKIYVYLEKHVSISVAAAFRQEVFDAVDGLTDNPERYGYDLLLLEYPPRYRVIRLGQHRIVFEIKDDVVYILLIYNARQNPDKVKKMMP